MIEMCIPSSLDPTLAPPGCHVISLFTQYTPHHLKDGAWTDEKRNAYADKGRCCITIICDKCDCRGFLTHAFVDFLRKFKK